MISRHIAHAALAAALTLFLQVGGVSARNGPPAHDRPGSRQVVGEETYNRVLDIVFPQDDPAAFKPVWNTVLRFRPSFKSESQILIRRGRSKSEVILYTSPEGSIYGKLNSILARTGKENAAEMAKEIRVERTELDVPYAQVKRWYAALFDSIGGTAQTLKSAAEEFDKRGTESFVIDGTVYEFSHEHLLNRMSYRLYDVEVDKPGSDGEFKLVQWMNAVRRDVQALKQQAKAKL
jgi:hypothetical protein